MVETKPSYMAHLCGESGLVVTDNNDFLLMPIRGVFPIRGVMSNSNRFCSLKTRFRPYLLQFVQTIPRGKRGSVPEVLQKWK